MKNKLISIVIPTRNSAQVLVKCLESIKKQNYKHYEIIIVDARSTDNVKELAKKYKCRYFKYESKLAKVLFDAPHKINVGTSKALGEYIYWMDADMELTKNVLSEAVLIAERGADAVILPEDSFGQGIWAHAKTLERRCYWGDDSVESPRFLKKSSWEKVGGFDLSLGGGANDMDLYMKLREQGFKKRFMYGREVSKYVGKRPRASIKSFFPIRYAYIKNWKRFVVDPVGTCAFIIMRTTEYAGGFLGIITNSIENKASHKRT